MAGLTSREESWGWGGARPRPRRGLQGRILGPPARSAAQEAGPRTRHRRQQKGRTAGRRRERLGARGCKTPTDGWRGLASRAHVTFCQRADSEGKGLILEVLLLSDVPLSWQRRHFGCRDAARGPAVARGRHPCCVQCGRPAGRSPADRGRGACLWTCSSAPCSARTTSPHRGPLATF